MFYQRLFTGIIGIFTLYDVAGLINFSSQTRVEQFQSID